MSDAYADCVGGSLKLKTAAGGVKKCPEASFVPRPFEAFLPLKGTGGKRKKKKKKSKAEEVVETVEKVEAKLSQTADNRTPAQIAYDKIQEQRQAERILKKAQKTHKQRVEELNRHLDSLTEHYDIPKVSWTK